MLGPPRGTIGPGETGQEKSICPTQARSSREGDERYCCLDNGMVLGLWWGDGSFAMPPEVLFQEVQGDISSQTEGQISGRSWIQERSS